MKTHLRGSFHGCCPRGAHRFPRVECQPIWPGTERLCRHPHGPWRGPQQMPCSVDKPCPEWTELEEKDGSVFTRCPDQVEPGLGRGQ